ncbi:MAG: glycosyltransferase, partial [Flavobacteriales bacterium]
ALYQRARFYAQLSISEGFGCALAEAMLCGAVPIVSDAGSLPDVAGGTGYVLKKKNAEAFTALLNDASRSLSSQQAVVSRGSISSRFPEEQRRDTLLGLVHNAGSPA